jgi:hypothetical protein
LGFVCWCGVFKILDSAIVVEHTLKIGHLTVEIKKRAELLNKEKEKCNSGQINNFRSKGAIPRFVVFQDNVQRLYAKEAVEWAVLTILLKRTGAKLENIGRIYDLAIEKWGEQQSTVEMLKSLFDTHRSYPTFVWILQTEGLDLPPYIAADATPPKD